MAPLSALALAEIVVADGFDTQKDALSELYRTASDRQVTEVLIDVAADDRAPRPVRERALGRILVKLARVG